MNNKSSSLLESSTTQSISVFFSSLNRQTLRQFATASGVKVGKNKSDTIAFLMEAVKLQKISIDVRWTIRAGTQVIGMKSVHFIGPR